MGNPVNPLSEVGKLFVPLNIQDTVKTIQNTGSIPEGLLKATIPGTIGIGVNTYGTKDIKPSASQQQQLKLLKQSGASDIIIKSTTQLFQSIKAGPSRTNASDEINQALAAGIQSGDTTRAQTLADEYNKSVIANIKGWIQANQGKQVPKVAYDALVSALINLDNSSIQTRLRAIVDNPDKYKLKIGVQ